MTTDLNLSLILHVDIRHDVVNVDCLWKSSRSYFDIQVFPLKMAVFFHVFKQSEKQSQVGLYGVEHNTSITTRGSQKFMSPVLIVYMYKENQLVNDCVWF